MPRKMSPPSFQQDQHYPHPHPYHHRVPHPVKQETTPPPAATTTTNNNNNVYGRMTPPPSSLKVNRDSHMIKKSTGPSSAKLNQQQQQQRGPVIIYTHSPKVIHTNPRDFMALVQKLTGMSQNEEAGTSSKEPESTVPNHEPVAPIVDYTTPQHHHHQDDNHYTGKVEGSTCLGVNNNNNNNNNNNSSNSTDDNESSSVITDENCSSSGNNTGDVVGQFNNPYMTTPQLFDLLPAPPSNLPLYLPSSSDMLCYGGDPAIYDYDMTFPYDQIT